jgi:hypothetical protein
MLSEDGIHETLKCRWRICEAQRHDSKMGMAMVCLKRRFLFILRLHTYLTVASMEVELGKHGCSSKLAKQFIDDC